LGGAVRRQGETASKLKSKQGKRRRQTLMFTATWPPDVQRVANVFTNPKLASIIRVTQVSALVVAPPCLMFVRSARARLWEPVLWRFWHSPVMIKPKIGKY